MAFQFEAFSSSLLFRDIKTNSMSDVLKVPSLYYSSSISKTSHPSSIVGV